MAGRKLLKRWGGTGELNADIVQMAHHGEGGAEKEVYEEIRPHICIWPTPSWLWDNNLNGQGIGSGPWSTLETRKWMQELGVETHIKDWEGSHMLEIDHGKITIQKLSVPEFLQLS
ncbi:MAG: hypothetical protein IKC46_12815 [Lachnospiraceae bacterium]|nr:hypothetical protein [Lachnospiraceae bacterium]